MPYDARVFNVMVASPSEVVAERSVIRDAVMDWNAAHAERQNRVLIPIGWETHAVPEHGAPPQETINRQLLEKSDLLVALFWSRLGTPTDTDPSGTAEEIRRHHESGRPTLIYFSRRPTDPSRIDTKQLAALRKFQDWCKKNGLVEWFDSPSDLQIQFARHLATMVSTRSYFAVLDKSSTAVYHAWDFPALELSEVLWQLTPEGKTIVLETSQDRDGVVLKVQEAGGTFQIRTNGRKLVDSNEARVRAAWEDAVETLYSLDVLKKEGHKEEYRLTRLGYEISDRIRNEQAIRPPHNE